jgi:ABC-type multidrug transport system fused ATPase/permease subunit
MKKLKKILDLLTPAEKKRSIILLVLTVVMTFFDILGIASILPFMTILINPQIVETNKILFYLYQKCIFLGIVTIKDFLFFIGVGIFILLITSLLLRALTSYAQIRFALMREYNICRRLVEGYLRQPYIWFLSSNSSDISKNIVSDVSEVIIQTIVPLINVIVYTIVITALLALLLIVDFKLAIIVALVLSLSYGGIFFFMKNILSHLGLERQKANKERFILINEMFGAIKQVKIGGLEHTYASRFSKQAQIYAQNQSLSQAIALLPRYFFEGIAFGGMILLVLVLMIRDDNFVKIIPTLILYAFAGYRLMPAIQIIYSSITQLRFSGSLLDSLHKDLMSLKCFEQESSASSVIPFTKSITFNNICFTYPGAIQPALKNINISIPIFHKVGIIGSTGCGKTTMAHLILGLLDPNQGTICIDEAPITNNNKRSWQKNIGYVPQKIYLNDSSIASNIAFGVDSKDINQQAIEEASKIANLHNFVINELPQKYNTVIGERGVRLSGGQLQRIAIARALYHKPKVLILDEATSALDNLNEKVVMETINNLEKKITIIIIAHRLNTIKNCDNIFLLEKGEVKDQGNFKSLSDSNKIFEITSKIK